MTQADYGDLLAHRARAREAFAEAIADYDAGITLSATGAAPLAADTPATGDPAMSIDASFLGCPTLSLPVLQDDGLPLGLQILGAAGHDDAVLRVAAWMAQDTFVQPGLIGAAARVVPASDSG